MDEPFNRRKFQELLVYVATKSSGDPDFGATKLNKILFWSDFLAYGLHGRPITGARYQALDQGPAPIQLLPQQRQLMDQGAIEVVSERAGAYFRKRTVALREPDLSVFDATEISLVDEVMSAMRGQNATLVSEISHRRSIGWQAAGLREEIPYETVFLSSEPPSKTDLARGVVVAEELGLVGPTR